MKENRKHPRISYRGEVLINCMVKAPGHSLSEGGLFVSTAVPFEPGTHVDVLFSVERDIIRTRAEVRHAADFVGIGLMFIDLQPHHEKIIRHHVSSRLDDRKEAHRTILLIDDDPLKRRVYRSALSRGGNVVLEASDGIEALNILQDHGIDLVILDLRLKELSGLHIISCIRKAPRWKDIPIIVLSSKSSPYDLKQAKELGANEFLVKASTTPIMLGGVAKKYLARSEVKP